MGTSRIDLIQLDRSHEKIIIKWRNDPDLNEFLFSDNVITLESHRKWFEDYKQLGNRKEFLIFVRDIYKPIGTVGLSLIDKHNKKAEYGIIIGEKEYMGKGYAKEASTLILSYAFNDLLLNKIYLRVFEDNYRATKMYESIGFKLDGLLRQDIIKKGVYKNVIEMSILKEEWINA